MVAQYEPAFSVSGHDIEPALELFPVGVFAFAIASKPGEEDHSGMGRQ